MLFKPLTDARHGSFVGVRRGMWPMENTYLAEQDDRHATALSLADLGSEFLEKRFDVLPLDICAGGVSKDEF